jgi:hypothetical protein
MHWDCDVGGFNAGGFDAELFCDCDGESTTPEGHRTFEGR